MKQLPVPSSLEEAKRQAQENREACQKMGYQQYFTSLKVVMEEKRQNLMKTGSSGWCVSGGGGRRRDPFLYYTRVPSNWGLPVSTYGGGVNF